VNEVAIEHTGMLMRDVAADIIAVAEAEVGSTLSRGGRRARLAPDRPSGALVEPDRRVDRWGGV
jgi:hypothetical protein